MTHSQREATHPFLTAANDEVGFYVVLLQVGVSVSARSRLHVVVSVQVVQSGLGDVDAPGTWQQSSLMCSPSNMDAHTRRRAEVPGLTARLHLIGQGDVVGPNVKLPLAEPQDTAVHPAAVDAYTHVDVDAGHLSHQTATRVQSHFRSEWV